MSLKYEQFVEMMVEEIGLESFLHHLIAACKSQKRELHRQQYKRGINDSDRAFLKEQEDKWAVIEDEIIAFTEEIKPLIP